MIFIYVIIFLTLVAISAAFLLKNKYPHRISSKELLGSIAASLIVSGISIALTLGDIYSTQLLHGKVISKSRDMVSCEHSYEVCTGSGENKTCRTEYDHSFDYDWNVYTSIGTITIDRRTFDEQGLLEPERFSNTIIGEAVTKEDIYIDYISGSNSVFNTADMIENSIYKNHIPNYPSVYDYYRSNIILSTLPIDQHLKNELNFKLRNILAELGPSKENSTLIVITDQPEEYAVHLKNGWNNGKKNEAILVIGINQNYDILWTNVFSWSSQFLFNDLLSEDLLNAKTLKNTDQIISAIYKNVTTHFNRRPMEEFSYLLFERTVPFSVILIVFFIQILVNVGISMYNYKSTERHY